MCRIEPDNELQNLEILQGRTELHDKLISENIY